jgi:phage repressor protein C with HTH and peptisase S24 domain
MKPGLLGETFLGHAGALQVFPDAVDGVGDHGRQLNTSGCAFQEQKHTGMGFRCGNRPRMERTPDERRQILRDFINERRLRVSRWAKDSGVGANSIYNFLNGHSQALDPMTYGKLARTQHVPIWRLSGEKPETPSPTSIWVAGYVEAGSFKEAIEWDPSRWYVVDVPVEVRFRGRAKALEVRGQSMNLEYREGSIVIWVDCLDFRSPQHGDHVIVYRYAQDDGVEATVKELRVVNGKRWLWPRSDDPAHQLPVDVDQPGDGIASVEIKGIVVGDYRPRH